MHDFTKNGQFIHPAEEFMKLNKNYLLDGIIVVIEVLKTIIINIEKIVRVKRQMSITFV